MNSAKLTIRLPAEELEFAKTYARDHGVSLTALVHRYFARLRAAQSPEVPVEVAPIIGLIPPAARVREEHATYLEKKHRCK